MHPGPAPGPAEPPVFVLAPVPVPSPGPAPGVVFDAVHLVYTFSALNYTKVVQNQTMKGNLVHAVQDGVLAGIANHTLPPPEAGLMPGVVLTQQGPLCPCPDQMQSGQRRSTE